MSRGLSALFKVLILCYLKVISWKRCLNLNETEVAAQLEGVTNDMFDDDVCEDDAVD